MTPPSDHILRAMTDDGSFRVLAARTTDTVRGIVAAQELSGAPAANLGQVVTAAVLVRETMAPGNRVQVLYTDRLGSRLVGDAHAEGNTRGLGQVVDDVLGFREGDGATIQVVRILRPGTPHQGIVETTDDDTLETALHTYFKQSEQVETMVGLACVEGDGEVHAAGGYVIQLLPEVTEPPLVEMQARVAALGDLAARIVDYDADPGHMLGELMADVPHTMLADSPVQFRCPCGPDSAVAAAAALGEVEIRTLLDSGEELTITCDFCRKKYTVGTDAYRQILDR